MPIKNHPGPHRGFGEKVAVLVGFLSFTCSPMSAPTTASAVPTASACPPRAVDAAGLNHSGAAGGRRRVAVSARTATTRGGIL